MNNFADYATIALEADALHQHRAHPEELRLGKILDCLKERCGDNSHMCLFLGVFLLRYARGIANIFGNLHYRPIPIRSDLFHKATDITVVLPTTDIMSATIHRVLRSILVHPIHNIIISTTGPKAQDQVEAFTELFHDPRIVLIHREGV